MPALRPNTPEALVVAIGDVRTDEAMFAATLAAGGVAVAVGDHDSRARLHVTGPADVRRLLEIIRQTSGTDRHGAHAHGRQQLNRPG